MTEMNGRQHPKYAGTFCSDTQDGVQSVAQETSNMFLDHSNRQYFQELRVPRN